MAQRRQWRSLLYDVHLRLYIVRERRVHVSIYMYVMLVISHIMTDWHQVMCKNDLHTTQLCMHFSTCFCCAEHALAQALPWNTTWRSFSNSGRSKNLTVSILHVVFTYKRDSNYSGTKKTAKEKCLQWSWLNIWWFTFHDFYIFII